MESLLYNSYPGALAKREVLHATFNLIGHFCCLQRGILTGEKEVKEESEKEQKVTRSGMSCFGARTYI